MNTFKDNLADVFLYNYIDGKGFKIDLIYQFNPNFNNFMFIGSSRLIQIWLSVWIFLKLLTNKDLSY